MITSESLILLISEYKYILAVKTKTCISFLITAYSYGSIHLLLCYKQLNPGITDITIAVNFFYTDDNSLKVRV